MSATARPCTRDFFALVDTMDVATISALFAEDAQVAFGNSQPIVGIEQVTIPCVTIFHVDAAGKIDAYRVYFDVTPIYA